ncbi:hypothetical protein GO592_38480 (plasmid) [Rhodococcus sp. 21391]|nr:hypothetical protein GO592_38480 [Rhodococcus sp. 21391]
MQQSPAHTMSDACRAWVPLLTANPAHLAVDYLFSDYDEGVTADDWRTRAEKRFIVIILGLILLVIGFVAGISILWTIGIILLVIGVILALLGATGRAVGGRRHWF